MYSKEARVFAYVPVCDSSEYCTTNVTIFVIVANQRREYYVLDLTTATRGSTATNPTVVALI